jgi:hypothetical protein
MRIPRRVCSKPVVYINVYNIYTCTIYNGESARTRTLDGQVGVCVAYIARRLAGRGPHARALLYVHGCASEAVAFLAMQSTRDPLAHQAKCQRLGFGCKSRTNRRSRWDSNPQSSPASMYRRATPYPLGHATAVESPCGYWDANWATSMYKTATPVYGCSSSFPSNRAGSFRSLAASDVGWLVPLVPIIGQVVAEVTDWEGCRGPATMILLHNAGVPMQGNSHLPGSPRELCPCGAAEPDASPRLHHLLLGLPHRHRPACGA